MHNLHEKSIYSLSRGFGEEKCAREMKYCLPPKRDCIIKKQIVEPATEELFQHIKMDNYA